MKKLIKPSPYKGQLYARSSKSAMQRAVAIAGLARGTSSLINPNFADDSRIAMEIMTKMGAKMAQGDNMIAVTGGNIAFPSYLSAGESGLSARMFAPLAATFNVPITISGQGSLLKRPQHVIVDTLEKFGVNVSSKNGYLPVVIQGPLKSGTVKLDGSFTSQVLTGLLIALPFISGDSTLVVNNLTSKPYIDLTIAILNDFGIDIDRKGYEEFYIRGKQRPATGKYAIEPDWSGMAFHLVGGAIAGDVDVLMSGSASVQGDRRIIDVLAKAGADVEVHDDRVSVRKAHLKAFAYDASDSPDLFPPLVVLGLNAEGTSKIRGVNRLYYKESDRARALMDEFGKLGGNIRIEGDTMYVSKSSLKGGRVNTHNDHRIVMAAAIAGLTASEPVMLEEVSSVSKSYPEFFDDFLALKKHQGKVV